MSVFRGSHRTIKRIVVVSAAAAASLGQLGSRAWGAGSVYTGGGAGTSAQPVSGNFSTGFVPSITGSTSLELDFNTGATAYTATNDIGTLQVGLVQFLSSSGTGVGTIAGGVSSNPLNFSSGGSILQQGAGIYTVTAPIQFGRTLTFGRLGTGLETISGGITSSTGGMTFSGANTIVLANAGAGGFSAANLTAGTVLPYVTVTDSTGTGIGIVQATTLDIIRDTTTTNVLMSTSNSSTTDFTTNPSTDTSANEYNTANGTLQLASGANPAVDSLSITEGGGGTLDLTATPSPLPAIP